MKNATVFGVEYVSEPEPPDSGCEGCAGEIDATVCGALPVGCSIHNIIWVPAKTAPTKSLSVQLLCPEPTAVKPKIVIQVVGGCVTYVCGNIDVEVVLCDYDTEGTEEQFDAESFGLTEIAFR
jgi:hypothetical protein